MKQLETEPIYKEIFKSFTAHRNHIVRYSCHDWSGTWCDICIEQTQMKAAKSESGLNRASMRNSDFDHDSLVQTLNHLSDVKCKPSHVKKNDLLHKDLAKTRKKRDTEEIKLAIKLFEENNPFDHNREKKLLVSFSTGFTSNADDAVNAERAFEGGREIHIKLDGKSVTSTMEVKFKVQALSSLRNLHKVNEKKAHLNYQFVQMTGNLCLKEYDGRDKLGV